MGAPMGMAVPGAIPSPPRCAAPQPSAGSMGLAAGGTMRQKVYRDPHGIETWDEARSARVFVHIVNSELWREITGEAPPESPVTAKAYARANLPWFDLYDEHLTGLRPTKTLEQIKSVKELDADKSSAPLQDDSTVETGTVKGLLVKLAEGLGVRDGSW